MSKVKLDDRIENAMNAFFETDPAHGSLTMKYGVPDELVIPVQQPFSEKASRWSGLLRELLLFGPGSLFLYFITLAMIFFYAEFGIPFYGLFMLATAAFMTYAGLGDIRNTKNLAVPATVIAVASAVAAIRSVFPVPEYLSPYFSWAIYSFPVALIAAKLMQMWLAEKE